MPGSISLAGVTITTGAGSTGGIVNIYPPANTFSVQVAVTTGTTRIMYRAYGSINGVNWTALGSAPTTQLAAASGALTKITSTGTGPCTMVKLRIVDFSTAATNAEGSVVTGSIVGLGTL